MQHVHQEGGELVGFGGQGFGACVQVGVIAEQGGQVAREHPGAGARGDDDVVVGRECREEAESEVAGGGAIAGVIGGLAAAGLGAGNFNRAAGGFEQGDAGEGDAGAVQVHQAGDEQGDARRVAHHGVEAGVAAGAAVGRGRRI